MPTLQETIDSGCYKDCPRKEQFIHMEKDSISLEQIEAFYAFLQGGEVEGFTFNDHPEMSGRQAFSIIYFLQEVFGILPDRYERCIVCNHIYDSEREGSFNEGPHCGYCMIFEEEEN